MLCNGPQTIVWFHAFLAQMRKKVCIAICLGNIDWWWRHRDGYKKKVVVLHLKTLWFWMK